MDQHGVLSEYTDTDGRLIPIYSLTKMFIATLVMRAVEGGLLSLNEPLATYSPGVPDADRIQIHQLLNHTAGLPDYGSLKAYQRAIIAGAAPWTDEQFSEHTFRDGLEFAPGTSWAYSNPGYALLVAILENLWRDDLRNIVRVEIADVLGLTDTRVVDALSDPDIMPSRSQSIVADGPSVDVGEHYSAGWVWHRLIASTAAEVARFLCALFNGALLSADSLAAMTKCVNVPGDHPLWQSPGYGYGLMSELAGARGALYGHNGDGPGYCASGYYFSERRIAVAVLATCENSDQTLRTVNDLYDRA
ncbi:MAG: serine hydrolase [Gammaproteobacteria bacterium]|nr:serine hydrolase [Gammaproteobacteria bacterium]